MSWGGRLMLTHPWSLPAPATAAQDSAGRRVFVTIAPSAGAESANCPVVAGGRVGPDSMGGVTVVVSTVPCTSNSHNEYPYPVARAVPYIRTYRPGPVRPRLSMPPLPVVVGWMLNQVTR